MDFEFAFWQMTYLFISPQKVYRNFQYRKRMYRDELLILTTMVILKSLILICCRMIGVNW